jgi:hypothetical protein
MSRIRFAAVVIAVGVAVAACGGGGTTGSGGGTTTTSGGGATTSTSTSGTTSSTSTGASKPQAPHLDSVKPLNGGLNLTWTELGTCDTIEGERKEALVDYMVVITVNGGVGMAPDPTATVDQNYTYRLRCKAGGVYSDYSNELSANPKMMPGP